MARDAGRPWPGPTRSAPRPAADERRLVKGAYWDSEIKHTQEQGLGDYPLFTRKAATDVSYLACAKDMLKAKNIYPAFATTMR
jgi:proline dehydrogenase